MIEKMKNLMSALTIAAALAMMVTGCSEIDNIMNNNPEEAPQKVRITVGAGIADDNSGAQTRSAVSEATVGGKIQRTLKLTEGDKLYIYARSDLDNMICGFLTVDPATISADGKRASFTGELDAWQYDETNDQYVADHPDLGDADPFAIYIYSSTRLVHNGSESGFEIDEWKNGNYNTTDYVHIVAPDVNTLMTSRLYVAANDYDEATRAFSLVAEQDAILNCAISGLDADHEYSVALAYVYVGVGFGVTDAYVGTTTADASGTANFAILTWAMDGFAYTLQLTDQTDATKTATVELGAKNVEPKVYNVARTATVTTTLPAGNIVDLSALTGDYTAQNGDVLTGEIDGSEKKIKVTIAAGATVTLSNATIDGKAGDTSAPWAGITCEDDATILLAGTNKVTNFDRYYPAIYIAPGNTLTIGGTGLLTASNTYYDITGSGAGIGGGSDIDCGNIVITGGTITANGGRGCAAIGGGEDATCGDITISGGTVTATANNIYGAAGIGSGYAGNSDASCGNITISGAAIVTATGGENAAGLGSGSANDGFDPDYKISNACGNIAISGTCIVTATGGYFTVGIGTGKNAKCGAITITGGTVTAQGGRCGAGIGCGQCNDDVGKSECGNITIESGEGFTSVTAIKDPGACKPIGYSSYPICEGGNGKSTCGTIKFGGFVIYDSYNGVESYDYNTSVSGLNLEVTTTDLGGDDNYTDNTWVLTPR